MINPPEGISPGDVWEFRTPKVWDLQVEEVYVAGVKAKKEYLQGLRWCMTRKLEGK